LKGAVRAVEKVNRVYYNDASRTLDVTRESIVFESLSQVVTA
jgi:hypothetical protein